MNIYALDTDGTRRDWPGNTWVPKYVEVTDWYTLKVLNNKVTSTYIDGVRHDNVWVSDY